MPLPTEFVRRRARGSIRLRSPAGVWRTNRYSSPAPAPGTSADQVSPRPPSSRASGWRAASQPLKVPTTLTAVAFGAQTRNIVTPRAAVASAGNGIAPIPGRDDGVGGTPGGYTTLRLSVRPGRTRSGLQPRVDRLALEGEDAEDALVDAAERLAADEPLERLDPERELAMGEPALAREPPLAQPLEMLGHVVLGAVDDPEVLGSAALHR